MAVDRITGRHNARRCDAAVQKARRPRAHRARDCRGVPFPPADPAVQLCPRAPGSRRPAFPRGGELGPVLPRRAPSSPRSSLLRRFVATRRRSARATTRPRPAALSLLGDRWRTGWNVRDLHEDPSLDHRRRIGPEADIRRLEHIRSTHRPDARLCAASAGTRAAPADATHGANRRLDSRGDHSGRGA